MALEGLECAVIWQPASGKAEICQSVFVRAVDGSVPGELTNGLEGLKHLRRRAFKKATAAAYKKCVATKQGWAAGNLNIGKERYVIQRMPRDTHYLKRDMLPYNFIAGMNVVSAAFKR